MACEKLDMDGEDFNIEKDHETLILFLTRSEDWLRTVLECLESDENSGDPRQKHFIETFSAFGE